MGVAAERTRRHVGGIDRVADEARPIEMRHQCRVLKRQNPVGGRASRLFLEAEKSRGSSVTAYEGDKSGVQRPLKGPAYQRARRDRYRRSGRKRGEEKTRGKVRTLHGEKKK